MSRRDSAGRSVGRSVSASGITPLRLVIRLLSSILQRLHVPGGQQLVAPEPLGGALLTDAAAVQQVAVVGGLEREAGALVDEDDRGATIGNPADRLEQRGMHRMVEPE